MQVIFYIVMACALSWGLYYGVSPQLDPQQPLLRVALLTTYMFGPLIAALITTAVFRKGTFKSSLGLRFGFNLWWIAAWLMPPLIVVAAIVVAWQFPGVEPQNYKDYVLAAVKASGQTMSPEKEALLTSLPFAIAMAMVAGIIPNAIAAFGEEAGWRGLMWTQLRPYGFWKASFLVGFIWGVWHAPIIIGGHNYGVDYQGYPWLGVAAMIGFCIMLTPFMGLLRDRTGSVFPAAILHGTTNAVGGFSVILASGASPLIGTIAGLSGIIALAGVVIVVLLLRPKRARA